MTPTPPRSPRALALLGYLAAARNVGHGRAQRLWDAFGEDCGRGLRQEPSRVAALKIMPRKYADEAAADLRERVHREAYELSVRELLVGTDLPLRHLLEGIEARWGPQGADTVRRDPWLLLRHHLH